MFLGHYSLLHIDPRNQYYHFSDKTDFFIHNSIKSVDNHGKTPLGNVFYKRHC